MFSIARAMMQASAQYVPIERLEYMSSFDEGYPLY